MHLFCKPSVLQDSRVSAVHISAVANKRNQPAEVERIRKILLAAFANNSANDGGARENE